MVNLLYGQSDFTVNLTLRSIWIPRYLGLYVQKKLTCPTLTDIACAFSLAVVGWGSAGCPPSSPFAGIRGVWKDKLRVDNNDFDNRYLPRCKPRRYFFAKQFTSISFSAIHSKHRQIWDTLNKWKPNCYSGLWWLHWLNRTVGSHIKALRSLMNKLYYWQSPSQCITRVVI